MKIHIIIKSSGEYSDQEVTAESAFYDEKKARTEVEKLTIENKNSWNEYRKNIQHLAYSHLQTDDNHINFYIETVEIRDQL